MHSLTNTRVGLVGMGYLGLPLAVELSKHFDTVVFDIDEELKSGLGRLLECSAEELRSSPRISYATNTDDLKNCDFHIITLPTPVDQHKRPDISPLIKASGAVGKVLSQDDIVVYPGATEDVCAPILKAQSRLKYNRDFFSGCSPESINPWRQQRTPPSGRTPPISRDGRRPDHCAGKTWRGCLRREASTPSGSADERL